MKTFDEELVKDRVNRFPFVKMMGMKLLSCSGGASVMRCRVRQALKNSGGTLHGGVMGTLVDMSVATALRSVLPLTSRMTTVEYKVNLLKPVSDGVITARGSVIRMGKTIAVGHHGDPERRGGPGRLRFRHVLHPERPVAGRLSGYNGGDDGPVEAGEPVLKGES